AAGVTGLSWLRRKAVRKARLAAQMWRKMPRRSIGGATRRAWRKLSPELSHRPLQQDRQRATEKTDFFRAIDRRRVPAALLLPAQRGDEFLPVAAPRRLVAGFP